MFIFDEKFRSLIGIVLGAYFLLLGLGVLPRKPKNPEAQKLWRKKFGAILIVIGAIMLFAGTALAVRQ